MDLELRHLRVVCAIADAGSVTKAASVLGLAQPALTAQLQRIERALGGLLFERDRRGARATPLGELVLARARVLLPAVKGLQDEATRLASTKDPAGRYRIGAVNGPILGGLVHRISSNHPGAQVSTHASWSASELGDQILAGRLDFVLVGACGDAPPATDNGLAWRVVAADPVFLLLPEGHPLAGPRRGRPGRARRRPVGRGAGGRLLLVLLTRRPARGPGSRRRCSSRPRSAARST